jgi:hypothetical protein
LERIDGDRLYVKTDGKTEPIARADVLAVALAGAPPADIAGRPNLRLVLARDGSRLGFAGADIADGKLTGESLLAGPATVPLSRLVFLLRAGPDQRPTDAERQYEALHLPHDTKDYVVMAKKGAPWAPVACIVKSLSPE